MSVLQRAREFIDEIRGIVPQGFEPAGGRTIWPGKEGDAPQSPKNPVVPEPIVTDVETARAAQSRLRELFNVVNIKRIEREELFATPLMLDTASRIRADSQAQADMALLLRQAIKNEPFRLLEEKEWSRLWTCLSPVTGRPTVVDLINAEVQRLEYQTSIVTMDEKERKGRAIARKFAKKILEAGMLAQEYLDVVGKQIATADQQLARVVYSATRGAKSEDSILR